MKRLGGVVDGAKQCSLPRIASNSSSLPSSTLFQLDQAMHGVIAHVPSLRWLPTFLGRTAKSVRMFMYVPIQSL